MKNRARLRRLPITRHRAITRSAWALGAAAVSLVLAPAALPLVVREIVAWNVGALVFLTLAWLRISTCNATETKRRAAALDPGRTAVFAVALLCSTVGFFAAARVLRHAPELAPGHARALVGLSLAAVVLAWLLVHTLFTLRYAHLYYRDDKEGEGGLNFAATRTPDDFDFAYFALTIGMCFQVSDVVVASRQFRRAVLFHALLSFAFNTAILALALNLVTGFL